MTLDVAVVGAGPAGLYTAYLLKLARPQSRIRVFEQNPAGATFGFGVVFSDRALDFLRDDDPDTYALLTPRMETWRDISVTHRGETVSIDGIGFSAIGRLELLELLQARLASVGVECRHASPLASLDPLRDADLIVAADGVNSLVRETHAERFGARVTYGANRFVWYGTGQRFETLTQTFRHTPEGAFTAHHYRYAPTMSTFLVEVDAETWRAAGLGRLDEAQSRARCEAIFAAELGGHGLVSNKSLWRQFPRVRNETWTVDNMVLLGDAAHTVHFSIGSGTRLAMEDAIALVRALQREPRLREGLARFESERRPIVEKLVAAGEASMRWYEGMAEPMRLAPYDFAYSYISRSGRVSEPALARGSPRFSAAYLAYREKVGRNDG